MIPPSSHRLFNKNMVDTQKGTIMMPHGTRFVLKELSVAALFLTVLLCNAVQAQAEDERKIASITTEWKVIGANHRVEIMAYTDPDIPEITCYVSQAKTGGVSGSLGLAEDPSNFALSCIKTRPVTQIKKNLPAEARVFTKSTNIWFKSTRVHRIYDKKQGTVVYLAISRHLIDGSPANAVSAVPLQ